MLNLNSFQHSVKMRMVNSYCILHSINTDFPIDVQLEKGMLKFCTLL